jgi:hypothetical protein
MKKKLLFLLFLLSNLAFPYEGIVIVLQAPLYKSADDHSIILQEIRKGERVFLNPSLDLTLTLPSYIQTYDRTGNIAFIKSNQIKIITNDELEEQWPTSLGEHDPTDYRLEEPIPSTYPFYDHQFRRFSFAFTVASNPLAPYNYGSAFLTQNYSNALGIRFCVTKKFAFDQNNRFYFGVIGGVSIATNNITFTDGSVAKEGRTLLRLGPYFSYDAFRNSHIRLSTGAGAVYDYHISTIKLTNAIGNSEQRLFSGYSLSPLASVNLEIDKVAPGADLILGSDLILYLPYSQTAPNSSGSGIAWNGDKIRSSVRAQASFFIGVQIKY